MNPLNILNRFNGFSLLLSKCGEPGKAAVFGIGPMLDVYRSSELV
jgi:hypothetical protein